MYLSYGRKAWAVIGYTFQSDMWCVDCIIGALPTGEGERFDGWALAPGVKMTAEGNLDEIAAAFGIDRHDEWSYDSDEFPKVIYADGVAEHMICGGCGNPLEY